MSTFTVGAGYVTTPFSRRVVKRPSFINLQPQAEVIEQNKLCVDPPRYIKLGLQLDPVDGHEIGDFYLPFDSREHEPAALIIKRSGAGKSVCLARLHSELSFNYSRSQLIFDFKNQYKYASLPNDDPKHLENGLQSRN